MGGSERDRESATKLSGRNKYGERKRKYDRRAKEEIVPSTST